jgi:hypothetical protein
MPGVVLLCAADRNVNGELIWKYLSLCQEMFPVVIVVLIFFIQESKKYDLVA